MSPLYEIVILGKPEANFLKDLKKQIEDLLTPFNLRLGQEIKWNINPSSYTLYPKCSTMALYFGNSDKVVQHISTMLESSIPTLPLVSRLDNVGEEIPDLLRPLNCLSIADNSLKRIATAALECIGLLPQQRRVFLSYRRDGAKQAALQLFEQLSARLYDVFLDTHKVAASTDFQDELWHNLCNSDVLIMLETDGYFKSRWTQAEFARALSKKIAVFNIKWPNVKDNPAIKLAHKLELTNTDIDLSSGELSNQVINDICEQLETIRAKSYAARHLHMISRIKLDIGDMPIEFLGTGPNFTSHVRLMDDRELQLLPITGSPDAVTVHSALEKNNHKPINIIYDHIGLKPEWLRHLDWLGERIEPAKLIKSRNMDWILGDYE